MFEQQGMKYFRRLRQKYFLLVWMGQLIIEGLEDKEQPSGEHS
jgi:hypothetical protein